MSLLNVIKSLEDRFVFKKKAVVSGINFELALLNYEQDQMINSFPDDGDDPLTYYEKTRAQVLSYSIVSIDGEVLPSIVQVTEGDKPVTKEKAIYVREVLKKIPTKIVEKLFEIYIDFKDETDNKLNTDVEYQWYKTPEERKAERDKKEEEEKKKRNKEEKDTEDKEVEPELEEGPTLDISTENNPIVFKKIEEKDDEVSKVD